MRGSREPPGLISNIARCAAFWLHLRRPFRKTKLGFQFIEGKCEAKLRLSDLFGRILLLSYQFFGPVRQGSNILSQLFE